MQYQFNERYEYVKSVEFVNSQPLHILKIRYFKEDGVSGVFEKKEFRYSFDKVVWSPWNTLSQSNLTGIQFRDNKDFYLQIKYTRSGINSGNIQRWYLIYDELFDTPVVLPDSSINAQYLRGEGPEYYLDRRNHFGPYSNLYIQNITDGSSAGVYSHRLDTSLGSEFYFKRIEGANGISIRETGAGRIIIDGEGVSSEVSNIGAGDASIFAGYDSSGNILIRELKGDGAINISVSDNLVLISSDSSVSGTYNSVLDGSVAMPNSVGGIPANTTVSQLEGKTFSQMFDELLFPTAYPTLTNPSASFTISPNGLQEIGTVLSLSANASFSRGSINPQYSASSPYRSGLPSGYDYQGFGLVDVSSSSLSNSQTISNYTVVQGNQPNWSCRVYYDEGVQPFDSKGNPYSSPLSAGVTSFINRTFEGVYPIFATSVNTLTLTKQTLYSMISGNSIVINLANEIDIINRQKFEIPNAWLSSRPLVGVQQYNTFSSQWEYPGGSASASLLVWTLSSVNEIIQGSSVNYTRYSYNGLQRSSVQIRLIF